MEKKWSLGIKWRIKNGEVWSLGVMPNNELFLIKSLESSKCLFEVWLFNKGVIDNKIAMIAVPWKIFRRANVLTSNP